MSKQPHVDTVGASELAVQLSSFVQRLLVDTDSTTSLGELAPSEGESPFDDLRVYGYSAEAVTFLVLMREAWLRDKRVFAFGLRELQDQTSQHGRRHDQFETRNRLRSLIQELRGSHPDAIQIQVKTNG